MVRPETVPATDPDDPDVLRVQAWRLLAVLLARPPSADLLAAVAQLRADAASPLGRASGALAAAAAEAEPTAVDREFSRLFIGLELGEVVPYASWYRDGMLHGPSLIRVRDALARLGLTRAPGVCEPEDHAAMLLDTMADLIDGRQSGRPAPPAEQRRFFEAHLAPWLPQLFDDMQRAAAARFYRPVGAFGAAFLDLETEAFALPEAAADPA